MIRALLGAVLLLTSSCALVEVGAACQDGQDNDGDRLTDCDDPNCTLDPQCQRCGNGRVDDEEACDDGNRLDGDGCDDACLKEGCGDGVVDDDAGEACDDGNQTDGDGCDFRCEVDRCGDFNVQTALGERCDDGNRQGGDGCSANCAIERPPGCGDQFIDFNTGEQCDDGDGQDGDGCSGVCRVEFCGDGVVQPAREQCDDALPVPGVTCVACGSLLCGNGEVEGPEQCDDANFDLGDGCNSCRLEFCGDFAVQGALGEECDDGPGRDGDGCSAQCLLETCGDLVLQPSRGELCDGTPGCAASCNAGRLCDDGGACVDASFGTVSDADAVAFLDLDGDGDADLIASSPTTGLVVATLVGAAGALPEVVVSTGAFIAPASLAPLHADDDLLVDFVGINPTQLLVLLKGAGAGLFAASSIANLDSAPGGVAVLDVTGDGHDDVVVSTPASTSLKVFPRGGPGEFLDPDLVVTSGRPRPLAVIDLDQDGDLDLVAGTDDRLLQLRVQGGALVETVPLEGGGAQVLEVADVDGDGRDDLLLSSPLNVVMVRPMGATGLGPARTLIEGVGATLLRALDLDGDGDLDVATASRQRSTVSVLLQQDGGAFTRRGPFPAALSPVSLAAGDLDGDGIPDVVTAGGNGFTSQVLLLRGP